MSSKHVGVSRTYSSKQYKYRLLLLLDNDHQAASISRSKSLIQTTSLLLSFIHLNNTFITTRI